MYLGRAEGAAGAPSAAALKVFRSDADGPAVDRQVRALLAVSPGTLSRLADVATTPDGRACLVLDRLAGPTLAGLLADRGRLAPGEIVTIVATVTTALHALHTAGFGHAAVTPASVRFDDRGRPVLLGLGDLVDLPAGAGGVARRRDDLVRLAGFVRSVVDHLDHRRTELAGADAVLAAFDTAATVRPLPADLTGPEAALFTWCPATAVAGAAPGASTAEPGDPREPGAPRESSATVPQHRPVPARPDTDPGRPAGAGAGAPRAVARTRPIRGAPAALVTRLRRAAPVWRAALPRLPGGAARAARSVAGAVRSRGDGRTGRTRVRAHAARIPAKPVLVGIGLAVLLVWSALAGLTGTSAPAGSGAGADATSAPATAPPTVAATTAAGLPEPAGSADPAGAPSLQADDPAAAVLDLLRLREACLAETSVLCLDGVDQAGSVVMAADGYLVRELQATDAERAPARQPPVATLSATVRERSGNAALVALSGATPDSGYTQPASALVIKGEAGWRLRELFDY